MQHITSTAALVRRAARLAASGDRRLLGIAGPPGAGKSTLATTVVSELDGLATLVPMDGFHLRNRELRRVGRSHRKGAQDTFDAVGYVSLLRRLAANEEDVVLAPEFDREQEEPVPDAIAVPRTTPLVVTEGNYLLVPDPPWGAVRGLLSEAWYVDIDPETRVDRLIDRHVHYGRSRTEAEAWVYDSDELNAAVVAATRDRADVIVTDLGP